LEPDRRILEDGAELRVLLVHSRTKRASKIGRRHRVGDDLQRRPADESGGGGREEIFCFGSRPGSGARFVLWRCAGKVPSFPRRVIGAGADCGRVARTRGARIALRGQIPYQRKSTGTRRGVATRRAWTCGYGNSPSNNFFYGHEPRQLRELQEQHLE